MFKYTSMTLIYRLPVLVTLLQNFCNSVQYPLEG